MNTALLTYFRNPVLLNKIFAGFMHFFKSETVLCSLWDILFGLIAGEILTFGANPLVINLAALSYLTILAEFIVVGRNRMTAMAGNILWVKGLFRG